MVKNRETGDLSKGDDAAWEGSWSLKNAPFGGTKRASGEWCSLPTKKDGKANAYPQITEASKDAKETEGPIQDSNKRKGKHGQLWPMGKGKTRAYSKTEQGCGKV